MKHNSEKLNCDLHRFIRITDQNVGTFKEILKNNWQELVPYFGKIRAVEAPRSLKEKVRGIIQPCADVQYEKKGEKYFIFANGVSESGSYGVLSVYSNHNNQDMCIEDVKSDDSPEQVAQKMVNYISKLQEGVSADEALSTAPDLNGRYLLVCFKLMKGQSIEYPYKAVDDSSEDNKGHKLIYCQEQTELYATNVLGKSAKGVPIIKSFMDLLDPEYPGYFLRMNMKTSKITKKFYEWVPCTIIKAGADPDWRTYKQP